MPESITCLALPYFAKYFEKNLTCPITFDFLTSPHITPCGHTFDYPSICQSLEHKKICPIDRNSLFSEQLIPNNFIKKLADQRIMILFLAAWGKDFEYECSVNRLPLFEAVKLPCGHTFNHSGISKWYENHKICPLDGAAFDIADVVPDMEKRRLTEENYPQYLEEIKQFNSKLTSQVVDLQLDDRNEFINQFAETIICPLSNALIKKPVVATCGHTFDLDSIQEDSLCPHDSMKITKSSLCINRLAQNILEELDKHPEIMLTTDREDRRGVFIFLKPSSNLMRVGKIAKALGIFQPPKDPYPYKNPKFTLTGGYTTSDLETPLSQIKRLNEVGTIPKLHPVIS